MTYREQADTGPGPTEAPKPKPIPEPLVAGPRTNCPMCGHVLPRTGEHGLNGAPQSKICSPSSRVGWFSRCKVEGVHLHQKCSACGAKWLRGPATNGERLV